MHAPRKAALLWSGGKDSALALHHTRRHHPDLQIEQLVTCVSQEYDRVSMHGVRRELIEDQADAIGLPVRFVVIPSAGNATCPMAHATPGTTFPPNDVYTRSMLGVFAQLRTENVGSIVLGDIFLEDLRAYRDRLLTHAGLVGRYPLWGRDTGDLFAEFVALGFAAVTVCIDVDRLPVTLCGHLLDPAFRTALPPGVDVCGERGEYHSFAFAGPPFHRSVEFTRGEIHRHDPFAFQELYLATAVPARAR